MLELFSGEPVPALLLKEVIKKLMILSHTLEDCLDLL